MFNRKRKNILKVLLGTVATVLLALFIGQVNVSASSTGSGLGGVENTSTNMAGSGTATLSTSDVGSYTMNSTSTPRTDEDDAGHYTKFGDFCYSPMTITVSSSGSITISTSGRGLDGTPYYYQPFNWEDEEVECSDLHQNSESWSDGGDGTGYTNYTKYSGSGFNLVLQQFGAFPETKTTHYNGSSWTSTGWHFTGSVTLYITLIIAEHDSTYDAYSNDSYDYYALTFSKTITLADTTPPQISGVSYAGNYNTNKTITLTDYDSGVSSDSYYTKNSGSKVYFSSGTVVSKEVSSEGNYYVYAKNKDGYYTTTSFTIDKTAPSVSGASAGAYYTSDRTISYSDNLSGIASAKDNGSSFSSGAVISSEGTHTIVVKDNAGNGTPISFTIDKTKPSISGVTNGTHYKSNVTVSWSDTNLSSCSINNVAQSGSSTLLTSEGSYSILVTDKAGNSNLVNIVIDKTAPTISGITNGGYSNQNQTITISDANLKQAYYTMNNGSQIQINSSVTFTEEGEYKIYAEDYAGNSTTYTYTIERSNPTFKIGSTELQSGETYYYNSTKTITLTDSNGLASYKLTKNGSSTATTVSGKSQDVKLTSEASKTNTYVLEVTDLAGNTSSITIVLDCINPTLIITDGSGRTIINGSSAVNTYVLFDSSDGSGINSNGVVITDSTGKQIDYIGSQSAILYYYKKDNSKLFSSKDSAFQYAISKEKATIEIHPNSLTQTEVNKLYSGANGSLVSSQTQLAQASIGCTYYTYNDTFWINYEDLCAYIDKLSSSSLVSSLETSTLPFADNGTFTAKVTDLAGNETSITFTIDNIAPEGSLIGNTTNSTYTSGESSNEPIYFTWEESNCTATLDGTDYAKNTVISSNGIHTLILTDLAGNTTTYTICIDTKSPLLNGVVQDRYYNASQTITWSDISPIKYIKITSDISIETIVVDASSLSKGSYKINISDFVSETYPLAHITIQASDILNNEETISFYYDIQAPTISGISSNGYYKTITSSVTDNGKLGNAYYTRNGGSQNKIESTGYTFTTAGSYIYTVYDLAGNSSSISFTIDLEAPTISGFTNGGYSKNNVNIAWSDNCNCEISYTYNDSESIVISTDKTGSKLFENKNEGYYVITARDIAGNETTISFTIDKTPIAISLFTSSGKQVNDGDYANEVISAEFDKVQIKSQKFSLVKTDGTEIKNQSFDSATFTSEGTYTLILTDLAGNETIISFTIDLTQPQTGGFKEITNGTYVGKKSSVGSDFNWNEDVDGVCKVDLFYIDYSYLTNAEFIAIFENEIVSISNQQKYYNLLLTWKSGQLQSNLSQNALNSLTSTLENIRVIVLKDRAGNMSFYYYCYDNTAPSYNDIALPEGHSFVKRGEYEATNQEVEFSYNKKENNQNTVNAYWYKEGLATFQYVNSTNKYYTEIEAINEAIAMESNEIINMGSFNASDSSIKSYFYSESEYLKLSNGDNYYSYKNIYFASIDSATAYITNQVKGSTTKKNYIVSSIEYNYIGASSPVVGTYKFTEEGTYYIKLYDTAGNETIYKLEIDKTGAIGEFKNVEANSITNITNGYFTWKENNAYATISTNGIDWENYTKGSTISTEGRIYIRLFDELGNYNDYSYEIDVTAPKLELIGVEDGGYTNLSKITAYSSELNTSVATANGTYTVNGSSQQTFTNETSFTEEGTYTLILTDLAGNSTTASFTIDRTAPTGSFVNIVENGISNSKTGYFTPDESNCSITLDNEQYTSKQIIAEEGTHTIVITDLAGNSTIYTFELDYTAPTYNVYTVDPTTGEKIQITIDLSSKGYYNKYLIFEWAEKNCNPEDSYNLYASQPSYSESEITSSNYYNADAKTFIFRLEEENYFKLYDAVGNYTEYNFKIDFTPNTANYEKILANNTNYISTITHWYETKDAYYNSSSFAYSESQIGYSFATYSDALIFAKARELAQAEVKIYSSTNSSVYTSTLYQNKTITVYDSQYASEGVQFWIYKAINSNGSSIAGYMAYHSETNLNKAIEIYAKESIKEENLFTKPNGAIRENQYAFTTTLDKYNSSVADQNLYTDNIYLVYNGTLSFTSQTETYLYISYNGGAFEQKNYNYTSNTAGTYNIREVDYAGNVCEYTIILDAGKSKFILTDNSDNKNQITDLIKTIMGSNDGILIRYTSIVRLSIVDELDANAIIQIKDKSTTEIQYCYYGNDIILGAIYDTSKGTWIATNKQYTITCMDSSKNKKTFDLDICVTEMEAEWTDLQETDVNTTTKVVGASLTVINDCSFNGLSSVVVYYKQDGTTTYTQIFEDANGNSFENPTFVYSNSRYTLTYIFKDNGIYKITLKDLYNRIVLDDSFLLEKDKPIVKLSVSSSKTLIQGYVVCGYEPHHTTVGSSTYIDYVNLSLTSINEIIRPIGSSTNQNVSFNWQDNNYKVFPLYTYIYGVETLYTYGEGELPSTINSPTVFTDEGIYVYAVVNGDTYKIVAFEIDKTAPSGSFYDGSKVIDLSTTPKVNYDVTFSWEESGCTATLDGQPYTSGSVIQGEGTHTIILTDRCGNKTSADKYVIVIDKTAPKVTISGAKEELSNGAITNKRFSFQWNESTATALLNGQAYTSGTFIKEDGVYTLLIYDALGNKATYTVTLDSVPLEIKTISEEGNYLTDKINQPFKFVCQKNNTTITYTLKFNGIKVNDYKITNLLDSEGTYELTATDLAGNSTTLTVIYDVTAPEGYFVNSNNNEMTVAYSNSTTRFKWDESTSSVSAYYIYSSTSGLTYSSTDDIAPSQIGNKISDSDIINYLNNYAIGNVLNIQALTDNLTKYNKSTEFNKEGFYYFLLIDTCSNYNIYMFEIDKTPSYGKLLTEDNDELSNGAITNQTLYFTWDDENAIASYIFNNSKNEENYIKDSKITQEGTYTFYLYDKCGNKSTITFVIDKTAPTGNWRDNNYQAIENNSISMDKKVNFYWQEQSAVAKLNGKNYTKGTSLNSDGEYEIILTDLAGNSSVYKITIDTKEPEGTLIGVENNGLTKDEVSLFYDSSIATATLRQLIGIDENGKDLYEESPYINGTPINREGYNEIVLTKITTGVTKTYCFTQDFTAPEITITTTQKDGFVDGNLTNGKVTITWSESNVTVLVNDASYSKNTTLSASNYYSVVATDKVGNVYKTYFIIDTVKPVGYLSIDNGSTTNEIVSFSYEQTEQVTKAYYVYNNVEYAFSEICLLEEEGTYEIYIYDLAGNFNKYTCSIDKTPALGYFYNDSTRELVTNEIIDFTFYFGWNEQGCKAYVNGQPYSKNDPIYKEGTYEFKLYDNVLNEAIYTITIDKSYPKGSLIGVGNAGSTADDVKFEFEDGLTCIVVYKNVEKIYQSGQIISEEGEYTLKLTNFLGHTTNYTFTIDKTAPEGYFVNTTSDNYTNHFRSSFTWTEKNLTCTLDGVTYSKGTDIRGEGIHTLILTDLAGNESSYTLVIDRTAPTGILSIDNNGYTKDNVTFNFEDADGCGNCTATLNGEAYTSGTEITSEGTYEIVLTDKALNYTKYTFTIDRTAPTGKFTLSSGIEVTNNSITNKNFIFSWKEQGCKATINGIEYLSGTTVSQEGTYEIILIDKAGNENQYYIILDKTAPIITNIKDGDYYADSINLQIEESNDIASMYYTLNNVQTTFDSETTLTEEGKYEIVVTDIAGNTNKYTIVIDKTAPYLIDITNNGYYNTSLNLNYKDNFKNGSALLSYNGSESFAIYNDYKINAEGSYTIVLTDFVGNTAEYQISIDKTKPIGNLIGVLNGSATNQKVAFTVVSNDIYLSYYTKDGETTTFTTSSLNFIEDGEYSIVLIDYAQNETIYTFTIDTIPVDYIQSGIMDNGYAVTSVIFSWIEQGAYAKLNGEVYRKGTPISANGEYLFEIYDTAGNVATLSFIIDATEPEINIFPIDDGGETSQDVYITWSYEYQTLSYSLDGGETYYSYSMGEYLTTEGSYILHAIKTTTGISKDFYIKIDRTAPEGTLIGVEVDSVTKDAVSFTWDEDNCSVTLNGKPYKNGDEIIQEGTNIISITDLAGNERVYQFTQDFTAPEYKITSNQQTLSNNSASKYDITIEWTEYNVILTINGNVVRLREKQFSYNLTEEGKYEITLSDKIGNVTIINLEIDRTAPEVQLYSIKHQENIDINKPVNHTVYITWDEKNVVATLDEKSYSKQSYISTEGNHIFTITDAVGNTAEYVIIIDKTPADAIITTTQEGGFGKDYNTNGNITITWEESNCTATLNGEPYESNTEIIVEGDYEFILYDEANNPNTYILHIDRTAPEGEFVNIVANGVSNSKNGYFTWIGSNYTCILDNVSYSKNTVIKNEGVHELILIDLAKNQTVYTFELDYTNPIVELIGVADGGYTNQSVIANIETNCISKLNNDDYVSGTEINDENVYTLVVYDLAGNKTTVTFTIDRVAPEITLVGCDDNGTTANNVYATWKESGVTALLNGSTYIKGTTIKEESSYTLLAYDLAGNETMVTWAIDFTKPEAYFYNDNTLVSFSNRINYYPTIVLTDLTDATISFLNEQGEIITQPFVSGTTLQFESDYELTLIRTTNQKTITYSFNIDVTAPEGELVTTQDGGFRTNNVTNGKVTFTWNENGCKAYISKDNGEYNLYSKNSVINKEGIYSIKLYDANLNFNEYTFEIDKTIPVLTLEIQDDSLTTTTNTIITTKYNIKFIISDAINVVESTNPDELLDDGYTMTESGSKVFYVTNVKNGSIVEYSLSIYRTAPEGYFSTTENNSYDNKLPNEAITDKRVYFINTTPVKSSVIINFTSSIDGTTKTYSLDSKLDKDGTYIATITDIYGNSSSITLTIDTLDPSFELFTSDGKTIDNFVSKQYFNQDLKLVFDSKFTFTVNGKEVSSGFELTGEEDETILYEIKGLYKNNNHPSDTFYISIDKEIPDALIYAYNGSLNTQNPQSPLSNSLKDYVDENGNHIIEYYDILDGDGNYINWGGFIKGLYDENNLPYYATNGKNITFKVYEEGLKIKIYKQYYETETQYDENNNEVVKSIAKWKETQFLNSSIKESTTDGTWYYNFQNPLTTSKEDGVYKEGKNNGIYKIVVSDLAGNEIVYMFELNLKQYLPSKIKATHQVEITDEKGNTITSEELINEIISTNTKDYSDAKKEKYNYSYSITLSDIDFDKYTILLTFTDVEGNTSQRLITSLESFTEEGNYKLTIYDKYGNVSYDTIKSSSSDNKSVETFEFNLSYPKPAPINYAGHNLPIIIVVVVVCALIFLIIILKFRGKNKNGFKSKKRAF